MALIGVPGFLFACITFSQIVTWVTAPCATTDPVNVWPLGQGIGAVDILTLDTGVYNDVQFMTGPPGVGAYNTTMFSGASTCYAELPVPVSSGSGEDFTIQFHAYFDDVTTGTFMEYRTDTGINNTGTDIYNFQMYLINGTIEMNVDDYGTHNFSHSISAQTWYRIVLKRDMSKNHFSLYLDGIESKPVDIPIGHMVVILPGSITLGGDFALQDSFKGALSCIQWTPCKDSNDISYDTNCYTANWPSTNSTSSTTSTPPTTSMTTTMTPTPTTTSTTTNAPTTSSTTTNAPTTSSTTTNAPTTSSTTTNAPTTSSTTTNAPTTSSTATYAPTTSSTTTNAPTTSSTATYAPTTSSTTTNAPTTSSTATYAPTTSSTTTNAPTTSSTTTNAPTTSSMTTNGATTTPTATSTPAASSTPNVALTTPFATSSATTIAEFDLTAGNATFAVAADIISVVNVDSIVGCANLCVDVNICSSFAVKNAGSFVECKLSFISSASTISQIDSLIYQRR